MDDPVSPPPSSSRRQSLVVGTVAALVALAAAVVAAVGAQAWWGDDGDDRPEPEVVLRFDESDQDPEGLLSRAAEGDVLPDQTFPRLEGGTGSFADYRGRPLVVNFFASWCPPCIAEMPDLEAVHRRFGDQVAFLGVNLRDPAGDAAELVAETGVTYDIGRDPSGDLFRSLGGVTMPSTFLVDPDGRVVEVIAGKVSAGELGDKLARLLR